MTAVSPQAKKYATGIALGLVALAFYVSSFFFV